MWGHSGKVGGMSLMQRARATQEREGREFLDALAAPRRNAWMLALAGAVEDYNPGDPWVICFNCSCVFKGLALWRKHRDEWDAWGMDCRNLPTGRCVID